MSGGDHEVHQMKGGHSQTNIKLHDIQFLIGVHELHVCLMSLVTYRMMMLSNVADQA